MGRGHDDQMAIGIPNSETDTTDGDHHRWSEKWKAHSSSCPPADHSPIHAKNPCGRAHKESPIE